MSYKFVPKDDISPHELAKLIPLFVVAWRNSEGNLFQVMQSLELPAGSVVENVIEHLPPELRRHFSPSAQS